MSKHLKFLFVLVIVAIMVVPALAEINQGAGGSINGNGNVQNVSNTVYTHIDKAKITENTQIDASTNIGSIVYEAPEDLVPNIAGLDIGTADITFMVYPMEVVSFPLKEDETWYIRSGTPVAVYTIANGNDRMLLESDESLLTYDPIYHRFNHGIVSPVTIFPKFTTRCEITSAAPGYLVLDNRYFPDYTMVEISPTPF